MNQKELRELIEFLIEKDIAEFELERGDVKVRIKRRMDSAVPLASAEPRYVALHATPAASPPQAPPAEVAPVPSAPPAVPPVAPEPELHMILSPIVGTFYEAPSPGAPPFVRVGDAVEVGHVLCIIEAMKLMNEIESDVAGEVVKKLVSNGQPVEYGQALFGIRPRG
jgi:acetyl-CoA carboxylase biotin carboxyl carrier protein